MGECHAERPDNIYSLSDGQEIFAPASDVKNNFRIASVNITLSRLVGGRREFSTSSMQYDSELQYLVPSTLAMRSDSHFNSILQKIETVRLAIVRGMDKRIAKNNIFSPREKNIVGAARSTRNLSWASGLLSNLVRTIAFSR